MISANHNGRIGHVTEDNWREALKAMRQRLQQPPVGQFDPTKHPRSQRGRFGAVGRPGPSKGPQPVLRQRPAQPKAPAPQAAPRPKNLPQATQVKQFIAFAGLKDLSQPQLKAVLGSVQTGFNVLTTLGLKPIGMAVRTAAQKAAQNGNGNSPAESKLRVFFHVQDAGPLKGKKIPSGELHYGGTPYSLTVHDKKQALSAEPVTDDTYEFRPIKGQSPKFYPLRYGQEQNDTTGS